MQHISVSARKYSSLALKTLVEICAAGRSEMSRITAAREILNRAWGQPDGKVVMAHQVDSGALQAAAERILEKRKMAGILDARVPLTEPAQLLDSPANVLLKKDLP